MPAPTYRWTCFICEAPNEAGALVCVSCGFSSHATGAQIVAERERRALLRRVDESTSPTPRERHFANDWVLFFPESLFAIITLLAAPFWALNQVSTGHYAAGLGLIAASAAGISIAVFAWHAKNKWLLYAAVLVVLSGGYFAMSQGGHQ